eukprot:c18279_g1_i4.p1 GENE.c18279_g1_i4~~c18279_g1_i4.p1  ORF type:complete len:537 (+),score=75.39 c18279_g1_i4:837-2447(+)
MSEIVGSHWSVPWTCCILPKGGIVTGAADGILRVWSSQGLPRQKSETDLAQGQKRAVSKIAKLKPRVVVAATTIAPSLPEGMTLKEAQFLKNVGLKSVVAGRGEMQGLVPQKSTNHVSDDLLEWIWRSDAGVEELRYPVGKSWGTPTLKFGAPFLDGKLETDVQIILNHNIEVLGHSKVLSRSPVLARLIEASQGAPINIENVKVSTFFHIFRFMYTNVAFVETSECEDLLVTALKMEIPELPDYCVKHIYHLGKIWIKKNVDTATMDHVLALRTALSLLEKSHIWSQPERFSVALKIRDFLDSVLTAVDSVMGPVEESKLALARTQVLRDIVRRPHALKKAPNPRVADPLVAKRLFHQLKQAPLLSSRSRRQRIQNEFDEITRGLQQRSKQAHPIHKEIRHTQAHLQQLRNTMDSAGPLYGGPNMRTTLQEVSGWIEDLTSSPHTPDDFRIECLTMLPDIDRFRKTLKVLDKRDAHLKRLTAEMHDIEVEGARLLDALAKMMIPQTQTYSANSQSQAQEEGDDEDFARSDFEEEE